jgi:cation transport regulator
MPYVTIEDLPVPVRSHLPEHAQEIYRSAFNHAWDSYATDPSREEIAHRVAWAAVKRRYRKAGADWVPLDDIGS